MRYILTLCILTLLAVVPHQHSAQAQTTCSDDACTFGGCTVSGGDWRVGDQAIKRTITARAVEKACTKADWHVTDEDGHPMWYDIIDSKQANPSCGVLVITDRGFVYSIGGTPCTDTVTIKLKTTDNKISVFIYAVTIS